MAEVDIWAAVFVANTAGKEAPKSIKRSSACFRLERGAIFHLFNRGEQHPGFVLRGSVEERHMTRARTLSNNLRWFTLRKDVRVKEATFFSSADLFYCRTEAQLEGIQSWLGVRRRAFLDPISNRAMPAPRYFQGVKGVMQGATTDKVIVYDPIFVSSAAGIPSETVYIDPDE